jgi:hypothetical protein
MTSIAPRLIGLEHVVSGLRGRVRWETEAAAEAVVRHDGYDDASFSALYRELLDRIDASVRAGDLEREGFLIAAANVVKPHLGIVERTR